jgi:ABC-2 type transport system permease protein
VKPEWTKLRTAPGTAWLLLGIVVATVGVGVATTAAVSCPVGCVVDAARLSLTGVQLGQAVVVVLAVAVIGGEYATGMIQVTLAATPSRMTVLAAKAAVLIGPVAIAGGVAVAGSLLAGRLVLGRDGVPLSLVDGAVIRAAVGSVLYLVLIALLTLGVGAAVRDATAAAGVVLGLLYVLPILARVVSDPAWQRRLERIGPTSAGLAVQATTGLEHPTIGPWAGLGVLAAWAGAALLAGAAVLRWRDA